MNTYAFWKTKTDSSVVHGLDRNAGDLNMLRTCSKAVAIGVKEGIKYKT